MNRTENRRLWASRIKEQRASGLSQVKWCVQQGLNLNTFKYWNKRIANGEITKPVEMSEGFVAVRTCASASEGIHFTIGRASVEVNGTVDLNLLSDVVKVLTRYA